MFKNRWPGKFIAFEGLDGAGCSTQAAKLANYFQTKKIPCWLTKEPTNHVIGGLIRGYLTGDWKINSPAALQLLFAADRANHLEKEIIPNLKKGLWVISDRYIFSSLAYGSLEIENQEWLYQMNEQFILPDLTILIKTSAKTCLKRIKENRLSLELFENENKLEQVWQTYEKIAKKYQNIELIDGEKNIETIFEEVLKEVNKITKKNK